MKKNATAIKWQREPQSDLLLRVLQEQSFITVGGDEAISVDVRIIAATHRSLREDVKVGRFREDLMYRLRVVPIFLPPLRERRLDVNLLLWHPIKNTIFWTYVISTASHLRQCAVC